MSLASFLDSIPFVDSDADRDARFPVPKKNLRVMYSTGSLKRYDGAAWVPQPIAGAYPILNDEIGLVAPANTSYAYGDVRRFGAEVALSADDLAHGIVDVAVINTPAVQNAILWSLGMTTLADPPAREGGNVIPVTVWETYKVTTIYCPSGTDLRGGSPRRLDGFTSTAAAPVLVLGRSLPETYVGSFVGTFRDLTISGTQAVAGQHGIQMLLSGGGNSVNITRTEFTNIKIDSMGGSGIRLMGDLGNMMIDVAMKKVMVRSCNEYGMHVKIGIYNQNSFDGCIFSSNLLGGFFDEYVGAGTDPSENLSFKNCLMEGNGKTFLNEPNATIGSFGFKSTRYSALVEFDNCYFEANGNNPADTTGANIWVQNPYQCTFRSSLNSSSNNLFWLNNGGNLKVESSWLWMGSTPGTAIFTASGAPTSSAYSFISTHLNTIAGTQPTAAQYFRKINGATTSLIGYTNGLNYVVAPPRERRHVLVDGVSRTDPAGAIGYSAVKRIYNNADAATSIPVGGVGTIIKDTFIGKMLITVDSGGILGQFLVSSTLITLMGQTTTHFTLVKDTALKVNVYRDAGLAAWVVQNNLAGSVRISVKFEGIDTLRSTDDGYYEGQFETH